MGEEERKVKDVSISRSSVVGRRMRIFAQLCSRGWDASSTYNLSMSRLSDHHPGGCLINDCGDLSWSEAMIRAEQEPNANAILSNLPLRTVHTGHTIDVNRRLTEPVEEYRTKPNASLPNCLQDLAQTLTHDLQQALEGFMDPDVWYPGVLDGISPVPDGHVRLVMWGWQRELDREPRAKDGCGPVKLPVPQLAKLPWRVQRALTERRRLRYQQFGIGREEWERNSWSLWNCQLDPEWVPPVVR